MKRFMYFSVGVLCLVIAALLGFHLNNRPAQAQTPTLLAFGFDTNFHAYVIEPDGKVWVRAIDNTAGGCSTSPTFCPGTATYVGNFWGEQPVPTSPGTIGGVKAKYR